MKKRGEKGGEGGEKECIPFLSVIKVLILGKFKCFI